MALNYTLIGEVTGNVQILGVEWLVPLILSVLAMLAITRDPDDMPITLLILAIGFKYLAGMPYSLIIMSVIAVIWVVQQFSTRGMRRVFETMSRVPSQAAKGVGIITQIPGNVNKKIEKRNIKKVGGLKEVNKLYSDAKENQIVKQLTGKNIIDIKPMSKVVIKDKKNMVSPKKSNDITAWIRDAQESFRVLHKRYPFPSENKIIYENAKKHFGEKR